MERDETQYCSEIFRTTEDCYKAAGVLDRIGRRHGGITGFSATVCEIENRPQASYKTTLSGNAACLGDGGTAYACREDCGCGCWEASIRLHEKNGGVEKYSISSGECSDHMATKLFLEMDQQRRAFFTMI